MPCDALKNFNDGVDYYQSIIHGAGYHIQPIRNPTKQEIDRRMEQLEEAKENVHHPEKMQKLNRLRNYLLEINYEVQ